MAADLHTAGTLVIVDACSVLDLIRAAARQLTGTTAAATALLTAARDPKGGLALAVTTEISGEIAANREKVVTDARSELRNLENRMRAAADEATALGLHTTNPIGPKWVDNVLALGIDLADRVLSEAATIPTSADDRALGITRSGERRAPAVRGSSMGDCIITETCLRIGRERGADTYFLSSNKHDYLDTKQLRSPLDTEFPAANLTYAVSWHQARNLLRL